MTSVCTGSLVYAAAGLLSGRPATTHWAALDRLAELDPTIDVRRDERFVDDGTIITSAGVSAGLDMALHLVDRLAGTERAREVRRGISTTPPRPSERARARSAGSDETRTTPRLGVSGRSATGHEHDGDTGRCLRHVALRVQRHLPLKVTSRS